MTLLDSFRIRIARFERKRDSDQVQISVFKNRTGSGSKKHYPITSVANLADFPRIWACFFSTHGFLNTSGLLDFGLILFVLCLLLGMWKFVPVLLRPGWKSGILQFLFNHFGASSSKAHLLPKRIHLSKRLRREMHL